MRRRMMVNGEKIGVDDNTLLLLHFDGNVKDVTLRNDVLSSPNSFVNGKFGQALYLNENIVEIDNSNINFNIPNWTIDFWYKDIASPSDYKMGLFTNGGFDWGGNAISIRILSSDGFWRFYFNTISWNNERYVDIPYTRLTTFTHIAMVKSGSTGKVYFNGNLQGTVYGLTTNSAKIENLIIGKWLEGNSSVSQPLIKGYIDEFRISDIARWTSDFTPPTTPYE